MAWRPVLNLAVTVDWLSPAYLTGLGSEVSLEGPNPLASKPTVIAESLFARRIRPLPARINA